jgi:hypothetical protein
LSGEDFDAMGLDAQRSLIRAVVESVVVSPVEAIASRSSTGARAFHAGVARQFDVHRSA